MASEEASWPSIVLLNTKKPAAPLWMTSDTPVTRPWVQKKKSAAPLWMTSDTPVTRPWVWEGEEFNGNELVCKELYAC